MNENKLVVDLDTCRITLASETEEKNHVELEVNEVMNGDKEWFKDKSVKTRQIIIKFFDKEEYRTDLTEESARELIKSLEANKNE